MTHKYIKRQYLRISAISLVAVVAVLFLLICAFFNPETAYAVCPSNYVEAVEEEGLDWYTGDAYLNLERVCQIVDELLSSDLYDFSGLEQEPIVIAIIDTGIQLEHELFTGKYDEDGNTVATDGIGEYDVLLRDDTGEVICANTYNTQKSVNDDASDKHGTHVAGIAATLIHKFNLEKYIKLLPIKASYPDGKTSKFTNKSIKDAISFALDNGADIINMSLSGDSNYRYSKLIEDGYDSFAQNAVFVAAAGNNKKASDNTKYYPAASENVLGIMSYKIDEGGNIALSDKSNYGDAYELCFPGNEIYGADGGTTDGYKKMSGTSMASPIASIAVALAMLKDKAQACATGGESLSATEIANLVKNSYSTMLSVGSGLSKVNVKVFNFVKLLENDICLEILCDCDSVKISRGDVASIDFEAVAHSDVSIDLSNAEWSVINSQGESVYSAVGSSIRFETAYSDTYKIVLTFKNGEKTHTALRVLAIDYMQSLADEIAAIQPDINGGDVDIVVNENESSVILAEARILQFDIGSLKNGIITPTTDILWYVNDRYVCSGESFECLFDSDGEYVVCAKINGVQTSAVRVIVQIEKPQSPLAMQIVGIALAASIVVGFVLALVLTSIKRR